METHELVELMQKEIDLVQVKIDSKEHEMRTIRNDLKKLMAEIHTKIKARGLFLGEKTIKKKKKKDKEEKLE